MSYASLQSLRYCLTKLATFLKYSKQVEPFQTISNKLEVAPVITSMILDAEQAICLDQRNINDTNQFLEILLVNEWIKLFGSHCFKQSR